MAVQIRVTADGVVVRFTGTDRVWACCRGVYLPLSRVLLPAMAAATPEAHTRHVGRALKGYGALGLALSAAVWLAKRCWILVAAAAFWPKAWRKKAQLRFWAATWQKNPSK